MGEYYGPSWLKNYAMAFWDTENWLYGSWDKEKYDAYTRLSKVPFLGDYMDYLLDRRSDSEYLRRYGMDYSDIHDPRKLRSTSSGGNVVMSSYRFVSRNLDDLYR